MFTGLAWLRKYLSLMKNLGNHFVLDYVKSSKRIELSVPV